MQMQRNPINSHRELIVWQKSLDLVSLIYSLSKKFPKEELFGLTSQIRRATVSIPSNIAEGRSRNSRKDFAHFLHIALGSAAETETQLEIAKRLKYVEEVDYNEAMSLLNQVGKMLVVMVEKLKARS